MVGQDTRKPSSITQSQGRVSFPSSATERWFRRVRPLRRVREGLMLLVLGSIGKRHRESSNAAQLSEPVHLAYVTGATARRRGRQRVGRTSAPNGLGCPLGIARRQCEAALGPSDRLTVRPNDRPTALTVPRSSRSRCCRRTACSRPPHAASSGCFRLDPATGRASGGPR